MAITDIVLHQKQEEVIRAEAQGARFILIKAGRKWGKTELSVYRMRKKCEDAVKKPGQINAYIAPYRAQAKAIIWTRLKQQLKRGELARKPMESELSVEYKNHQISRLFGADNEDGIRGLTFGDAILDEADMMRGSFWEEVVEPNLGPTEGGALFISTPKNRWFTKLWREVRDGLKGRHWAAFHFTTYDNPHISRDWIEAKKKEVPREVFEQEYMANEQAYSGLQYHEFSNTHIVEHREPKADALVARGIDWGWDHPTHCLWGEIWFNAETGRWNLYIYREFQIRGQSVQSLVTPIINADSGRNFLFSVIDSAAKRTEMGTGNPIIKEFALAGLPCRVPYGDHNYRINAAKMMLRQGDVQVSLNCPVLIKQLREVEWGQKEGDDAADAFKYFCSQVYKKDFSTLEERPDEHPIFKGPVDPRGLLAGKEPDTMQWSPAGYIA